MLSDRLLRPTLAVLATASEAVLIASTVVRLCASTAAAVEMAATVAVAVALELIKDASEAMRPPPSSTPREAATV